MKYKLEINQFIAFKQEYIFSNLFNIPGVRTISEYCFKGEYYLYNVKYKELHILHLTINHLNES